MPTAIMTKDKEKDNCEGIASAVESLIDTSTLAVAIAEPEEFAEDYCDDKRIEKRRPKIKHRANYKEKTTICLKRTCVYMLSYLGLTCIVVAYSILGGIIFRSLEEPNEMMVEQKAVDLRENFTKDLERNIRNYVSMTFPEHLRTLNENTSTLTTKEIENNVHNFTKDIRLQLVNMLGKILNQTENRNAQKTDQNNGTSFLKSKENEIKDLLSFSSKALVEQTSKIIQNKMKRTKDDLNTFLKSEKMDMNTSQIEAMFQKFQLSTYDLVNTEGWNGVDPDSGESGKWTYSGGLLYAVTVITTIGYGTITPKTDAGKALTILYALIGIPLTVLCITNIGRGMAAFCRALYGGTFCVDCRQNFFQSFRTRRLSSIVADDIELDKVDRDGVSEVEVVIHKHVEVPILLSLILVTWYIAFGAIMFKLWEDDWTIFEGAYFCFITLSTIGFGDFVPGFSDDKNWDNQVKQVACSLYLLIGLATLAMCFDLLQQRGKAVANNFARFIGLVRKEEEAKDDV